MQTYIMPKHAYTHTENEAFEKTNLQGRERDAGKVISIHYSETVGGFHSQQTSRMGLNKCKYAIYKQKCRQVCRSCSNRIFSHFNFLFKYFIPFRCSFL